MEKLKTILVAFVSKGGRTQEAANKSIVHQRSEIRGARKNEEMKIFAWVSGQRLP